MFLEWECFKFSRMYDDTLIKPTVGIAIFLRCIWLFNKKFFLNFKTAYNCSIYYKEKLKKLRNLILLSTLEPENNLEKIIGISDRFFCNCDI